MTYQSRRYARLIAVAALSIYLSNAGRGVSSFGSVMTYEVTNNLVTRGKSAFDAAGLNQHRGIDGRYYSPFGIGQSLFSVPFYVAGRAAQKVLGLHVGRPETLDKAAVSL